MHLRSVARTLILVFFLVSTADASTNATASSAPSGTFSSTVNQPNALLSDPLNARDEERAPSIEDVGLGTELGTLLTKDKQAVVDPIVRNHLLPMLRWWRNKDLHPSAVFTNLQLNRVEENSLSNAWFHAWVEYVDSYNLDHPGEEVSILAKCEEQFDDHRLAMILEEAKSKTDPSIQALGTRLQKEQMEGWKKRSVSPQQLHNLLQSDPSHPILLTGRKYRIWNTYLTEYNPGTSMTHLKQLLHTFNYGDLSSLLIASKRSEKTATLATNLQLELEEEWVSHNVAPGRVFKYLMLDKKPFELLDNPELMSWVRYAKLYREKTGRNVTLAQVLVNIFDKNKIERIYWTANTDDKKKLVEDLEPVLAEKLREYLEKKLDSELADA